MNNYLRLINWDTSGKRCDVSPLFAHPRAFHQLLDDLTTMLSDVEFDVIAGVDALGFILGTGLALRAGKGLLVVRKGGKLPVQADVISFVDYTGQTKSLELASGAVAAGTRVLVVDEWIETGAQVQAAISLIERQRGIVTGLAAIHVDEAGEIALRRRGYRCFAISRNNDIRD